MSSLSDAVPGQEGGQVVGGRTAAGAGSQESWSWTSETIGRDSEVEVARSVPGDARWIVDSETPYEQLITFGPSVFEAYARLRFIADPSCPGQDEADASPPEDSPSELVQTQRALRHLAGFTSTPDDCCFCLWDGYPDISPPPEVGEPQVVVLPHRRYLMVRGPLSLIDSYADDFGSGRNIMPPAFIWPADRRWCFARDVDTHWAGVGGQSAALHSLAADDVLDVVLAAPDIPQPRYG